MVSDLLYVNVDLVDIDCFDCKIVCVELWKDDFVIGNVDIGRLVIKVDFDSFVLL